MPDVQEVFRMATQKVRPEQGFIDRQHENQRRRSRNRRAGAFVLAAALGIVAVIMVVRAAVEGTGTTPAIRPTPPPATVPEVDYALDLDTGEMTPLPASIVGEEDETGWYALSSDGSMLSFVGPGADGKSQIIVANLDGTGIRQVTNDPRGLVYNSRSAWSPNGMMIAYEGYDDEVVGVQNLFVVDLATGASRQVTFTRGYGVFGSQFTLDGSALLYSSGGRREGVWLAPIEGGRPTLLIGGGGKRGDAGNGLFSPDGSLLTYGFAETAGRLLTGRWIANADGTDPRQLTDVFLVCGPGSWSPDGTRLACSDGSEVFLIDVGTGAVTRTADGESATWLDDHTLIIDV